MQIRPPTLIAGASAALMLFREAPGELGPLQSRQGGRGGGVLAAPFSNAVSYIIPDRLCSPLPCLPESMSFGDLTSAFLLALRLAFKALQKPALKSLPGLSAASSEGPGGCSGRMVVPPQQLSKNCLSTVYKVRVNKMVDRARKAVSGGSTANVGP